MYVCENCNGNLVFDIQTQLLKCDHCDTTMDPYAFEVTQDAEEVGDPDTDFEITMFICPQCGGKILSDDTTAATFCSYCGGSTILDKHISREKRPDLIIPFKKTKADCKDAYVKMMQKSKFAPDDLKSEECISKFRSIYMPYWVYTAEMDRPVFFDAIYRDNNEGIQTVSIYRMTSDITAKFKGLAYDASSVFSDSLSNAIAPFDFKETRLFTPTFLSGFYADSPDVDYTLYEQDVKNVVSDQLCFDIETDPFMKRYEPDPDLHRILQPKKVEHQMAMYPVWFMSYRYKDRVGYALVNGQTGKAAGDIPADKKKYLKSSFLLSIPIFILLSLFVALRPSMLLFFTALVAAVFCYVSLQMKIALIAKEDYVDDKGSGKYLVFGNDHYQERQKQYTNVSNYIYVIIIVALLFALIIGMLFGNGLVFILLSVAWFACMILLPKLKIKPKRVRIVRQEQFNVALEPKHFFASVVKPGLAALIAISIMMMNPEHLVVYYGAVIIAIVLLAVNALDLIEKYNLLATRPLPQFEKRGGEADGK